MPEPSRRAAAGPAEHRGAAPGSDSRARNQCGHRPVQLAGQAAAAHGLRSILARAAGVLVRSHRGRIRQQHVQRITQHYGPSAGTGYGWYTSSPFDR
jgi:hypothetical protein